MKGSVLYFRLLRYVRPYRWVFGVTVLGMVVVAAGDLLLAYLVIPIVRNFQTPDPVRTSWLPFTVVGVFLLRGVGSYISEYGMGWTGLSRRVRPSPRSHRQAAAPADALLRHASDRRRAVEDLVRRAPARCGSVGHDHQCAALDADDHGELRLPAVAQLEADAADVDRHPDRRGRHPLFQPPVCAASRTTSRTGRARSRTCSRK